MKIIVIFFPPTCLETNQITKDQLLKNVAELKNKIVNKFQGKSLILKIVCTFQWIHMKIRLK